MIGRDFRFHNGQKGAALAVRVTKRSKADEFYKILRDGTVLVKIKNDPVDLNKALIKFLSEQLNIPRKKFDVIAGDEGEEKLLSILDADPVQLQELILSKIS